jgi:hypothetical protein
MVMPHPFRDVRSFSLQVDLMNHEISGMLCETYGNTDTGLRRLKWEKRISLKHHCQ